MIVGSTSSTYTNPSGKFYNWLGILLRWHCGKGFPACIDSWKSIFKQIFRFEMTKMINESYVKCIYTKYNKSKSVYNKKEWAKFKTFIKYHIKFFESLLFRDWRFVENSDKKAISLSFSGVHSHAEFVLVKSWFNRKFADIVGYDFILF
jgi:hypothetical protein